MKNKFLNNSHRLEEHTDFKEETELSEVQESITTIFRRHGFNPDLQTIPWGAISRNKRLQHAMRELDEFSIDQVKSFIKQNLRDYVIADQMHRKNGMKLGDFNSWEEADEILNKLLNNSYDKAVSWYEQHVVK